MSSPVAETSIQDGTPIYKFEFIVDSAAYRYTSSSYEMTDSNGTYTPESISLTNIITTNEIAKNGVQVTIPRDNAFAQLFLGRVPEVGASLTIYRSHAPDVDGEMCWKGRVASSESTGDEVTLQCEDIFTSSQRIGLRARYQKSCRHSLYGASCGVDKSSFGQATTILDVSGRTVTVSAVSTSPALDEDYFLGGIIELADGTSRSILARDGWVLTLDRPFNDLSTTSPLGSPIDTCTLYPGCNRTTGHCLNRFANLDNFGGYPYLPSKNPFQGSVTGSIA
jgi:hypothetical protein